MTTTTEMQLVDINKLIPYVNNARTHSPEQITKLRSSLREFGFVNPIIVDKDFNVLAGHGRLAAAKAEGITEVPCVFAEHLTEAQKKAYIINDNRSALDAGWDDELLKALEGEVFVQPGDIWLLGKHRLLCGDATKPEDVRTVLDGKKANVCITDPPYNCSYEGGTGMTIQNDKWSDSEKFYTFLLNAFKNIYDNTADGGAFYCFHSDAEKCNFYNATVNAGFHYSTTCIWVKDALVIGRADFQQRHEPCIYSFKDTAKHKFYGDRKQTTVWEFPRPKKSTLHPTMKTIPLIAYPMSLSSQENSIVLDVFGGSGTTLMAAERLNRVCCTIELDPKYASAIVRRFIAAKQGADEVFVIRNGEKLPCTDVYTPTEDDLAFKEDGVNRK